MSRLTRREAALGWNANAPLGMERPVPAKRVSNPDAPKEWKLLQAPAVKLVRERMKFTPHLGFIAAMPEMLRTPQRANIAKMCGLQRGIPDLLLLRNDRPLFIWAVEFKLPPEDLSDAQEGWFMWLRTGGVACHRCDNIADFARILEGFCK